MNVWTERQTKRQTDKFNEHVYVGLAQAAPINQVPPKIFSYQVISYCLWRVVGYFEM